MTWSLELGLAVASIGAAVCISAISALIFLRNERLKYDERKARRALLYARSLDNKDVGTIERGLATDELRKLGYIPSSELEVYIQSHKDAWIKAPKVTEALEISIGFGSLRINVDAKNFLSNIAVAGAAATVAAGISAAMALLNI